MLGAGYSLVKQFVEKIINKNGITWCVSLLVSAALYLILKGRGIWDLAANVMFTMTLVIFTMRVTFFGFVINVAWKKMTERKSLCV